MCMTPRIGRARNPRGQGPRLRADIIDAATQLVAQGGTEGLTLRAVARKAGITAPAIYAHFTGLAEILEALVDNSFDALADYMRRAAERCTDPPNRLRATCHAYVAFGRQYPNEYAVMFTHKTGLVAGEKGRSVESMRGAQAFDLVLEPLRACIACGASRSTDPEADATALWVALHGYITLNTSVPDFPWPPGTTVIDILIDHVAQLAQRS